MKIPRRNFLKDCLGAIAGLVCVRPVVAKVTLAKSGLDIPPFVREWNSAINSDLCYDFGLRVAATAAVRFDPHCAEQAHAWAKGVLRSAVSKIFGKTPHQYMSYCTTVSSEDSTLMISVLAREVQPSMPPNDAKFFGRS